MRPMWKTWIVALAAALAGAVVSVPTAAAAADPLDSPSTETRVGCTGAWADVEIEWTAGDSVKIYWRLEDTVNDGKSPVLRIQARDPSGNSAYIFRGDNAYFVLDRGKGTSADGGSPWEPAGMNNINNLLITVQNGTTAEGKACDQGRHMFNWTRMGYKGAWSRIGANYASPGDGVNTYDCSGLVFASYNEMTNFPGWGGHRRAVEMYNWAKGATSPGKVYAKQIAKANLKIGDLMFFKTTAEAVGHVGFYAGNGQMLDSETWGTKVRVHTMGPYYTETTWVAAYRILGYQTV